MKKLLSMMLLLMLTLSCTLAYSEQVEFRNGIMFGDDMDTVTEKEDGDVLSAKNNKNIEDPNLLQKNGVRFAGMDGCIARYLFDDNKLNQVCYYYLFKNPDELEYYNVVADALTAKYGEPLNNIHGTTCNISGYAFREFKDYAARMGAGYSAEWAGYQEWIVDEGDYKVKIDLVMGVSGIIARKLTTIKMYLSYMRFDKDEPLSTTEDILGPSQFDPIVEDPAVEALNDV